jgi:hypothetical protein
MIKLLMCRLLGKVQLSLKVVLWLLLKGMRRRHEPNTAFSICIVVVAGSSCQPCRGAGLRWSLKQQQQEEQQRRPGQQQSRQKLTWQPFPQVGLAGHDVLSWF